MLGLRISNLQFQRVPKFPISPTPPEFCTTKFVGFRFPYSLDGGRLRRFAQQKVLVKHIFFQNFKMFLGFGHNPKICSFTQNRSFYLTNFGGLGGGDFRPGGEYSRPPRTHAIARPRHFFNFLKTIKFPLFSEKFLSTFSQLVRFAAIRLGEIGRGESFFAGIFLAILGGDGF